MKTFRTLIITLALAACGSSEVQSEAAPRGARQEVAVFAGGCFWCTEADFEKVPGVLSAASGYTGGRVNSPTYKQVSAGGTGHYEAVRIVYDPAKVSFAALVRHYFRTVDPTDGGGQFCDRGDSYRTAIFAVGPAQRQQALAAKAEAERVLKRKLATPVLAAGRFWFAEDYHQDYYKKNPIRYSYYRTRCGRDDRLKEVWGAQAGK
ncbi:MAG TPA: peptide-methionine (S)-S-oxide reductase MsrA [Allosphingosinicella sp.]|jgi:peptide-methionine (S)-S-oxide reductase